MTLGAIAALAAFAVVGGVLVWIQVIQDRRKDARDKRSPRPVASGLPQSQGASQRESGAAPDQVAQWLEELDRYLGVKDTVDEEPLVRLHAAEPPAKLVQAIAKQMGLPIAVRISHTTSKDRFTTRSLSTTDDSGHGTQGIVAQVALPSGLPVYGSTGLDGYVIDVLLGDQFKSARPETVIALLAHELSHVLLHSLRHPRRESEQVTDLVPLMLGFSELVGRGRTVSTSEDLGDRVRTRTVTYGYLSDGQFALARKTVASMLVARRSVKARLISDASRLSRESKVGQTQCVQCVRLVANLDATRGHVRPQDGARVVAMHAPGYWEQYRHAFDRFAQLAAEAEHYAHSVSHYTALSVGNMKDLQLRSSNAIRELEALSKRVDSDVAILSRSRGIWGRLVDVLRRVIRSGARSDDRIR